MVSDDGLPLSSLRCADMTFMCAPWGNAVFTAKSRDP